MLAGVDVGAASLAAMLATVVAVAVAVVVEFAAPAVAADKVMYDTRFGRSENCSPPLLELQGVSFHPQYPWRMPQRLVAVAQLLSISSDHHRD